MSEIVTLDQVELAVNSTFTPAVLNAMENAAVGSQFQFQFRQLPLVGQVADKSGDTIPINFLNTKLNGKSGTRYIF